ncbi:MAG: amidohydrolase [Cyclobacteriaceae bacterium]|nr:amidohydrolase [Cyclobacteriaceae bacterium]
MNNRNVVGNIKKNVVFGWMIVLMMLGIGCNAQDPNTLKLKDYRPKSIYQIPISKIEKAKYPVIDVHSHPYAATEEELAQWVKNMDDAGIAKTIILTQATGPKFDSLYALYSTQGDRFEVWCGFDYTGSNEPGWSKKAVAELVRCHRAGAKGVGELGDKGMGESFSEPMSNDGLHVDDKRMKPLYEKCAELKMPVNIHVAEPYWMYLPMDSTNDGLMNAYEWKVDLTKKGILNHAALIHTLENAVRENPKTTFIACHLANCEYDLEILGRLFRTYSNLYAEFGARYGETAPIPRFMNSFCEKYQDRLLYGTDMGYSPHMYQTTFRILESNDEHFYEIDLFGYHWPLYGFGLKDTVLKKIYTENAKRILDR